MSVYDVMVVREKHSLLLSFCTEYLNKFDVPNNLEAIPLNYRKYGDTGPDLIIPVSYTHLTLPTIYSV